MPVEAMVLRNEALPPQDLRGETSPRGHGYNEERFPTWYLGVL